MKNREKNYDYLRSISCLAIVLLHVSSSYWNVVSRDSTDFVIMTVYNALTRYAVPVFMMLSGAFLLNPQKSMDFRGIFQRFGKTVIIFYVWSAFYAFQGIAVKLITGKEITAQLWSDSLQRFLWGHYHMWFVFLILGFYLLLPIARKICESKQIIEYFLILWILVGFVIPVAAPLVKMGWLYTWVSKLSLNLLVGYLGYFFLGYYIKEYGIPKKFRVILYVGGAISVLYSMIGTVIQSRAQEMYVETLFNPGAWNVLLFSAAVFTLFANMKEINVGYSFISKVSRYAFVIYLVHPFFLEKLNLIGVTTVSFHSLFSVPVLTVSIFLCSFVVAAVISLFERIFKR